ncbi:unnamed protein product [Darwinula stevensoni]|uniref:Uncharacterized protein n=1 Tax=Darwinula stevensoni TaxID=69355 RepID=A0A7R9FRT6_9CRUS|nr:unnamed protein product [Darwinula stevensoni]CAG0901929.1 unnamed protein product [Darwinula stevensoni]
MFREFFTDGGNIGVDQLDGICFVVPISQARLTQTQKYIFDSILAVFGRDVEKNIYILFTFSDSQKPPALSAINAAGIPFRRSFALNNSAFFVRPDPDDLTRKFWIMGKSSFHKFFNDFLNTKPVSLSLTKEVLQERKQLEAALQGILPQLQNGT